MIEVVSENEKKYYTQYIGDEIEVLFEQQIKDKQSCYEGLTTNYIKVVAYSDEELKGKLQNVRIIEVKDGYVEGEIIHS